MTLVTASRVRTRVLFGFDDPALGPDQWERLLRQGKTDIVYLTRQWQKTWWETFGRGDLLLIVAEKDGQPVALAPFYAEAGMVFFIGSGDKADNLDFIGDISDPEVLAGLLLTARECVPDFLGFRLYYISDNSPTGKRLREVSDRLDLFCCDEWDLPAPALDLAGQREAAEAIADKRRLRKYEDFFRREGRLEVGHLHDGDRILPHLPEFFDQHITRRAVTPHPSAFSDPAQRRFYEELTRAAANAGWLRFTRIDWEGRPIAFHFGFCYRGRFFWNEPTFALDLARRSPGQVLIRQLILGAMAEGAHTFDFGTVDLAFKLRFATHVNHARTWGIY